MNTVLFYKPVSKKALVRLAETESELLIKTGLTQSFVSECPQRKMTKADRMRQYFTSISGYSGYDKD